MYTVSTLAQLADTTPATVRFYTRLGLLKPNKDPRNGYKIYTRADKDRLNFTISAKGLGFTLAEIEQIFDQTQKGDSPCPMVREIVEQRVVENREKIKQLKSMQKRLENALEVWEKMENSQPDGHSVCRLIETFSPK